MVEGELLDEFFVDGNYHMQWMCMYVPKGILWNEITD